MKVAVDHCKGLLYMIPFIAQASYFLVSLFILLSGISAGMSAMKKGKTFSYQLKKTLFLYSKYAIATLILLILYFHFFDLKTYISHMLNFSIQGSYYFLLFFSSF